MSQSSPVTSSGTTSSSQFGQINFPNVQITTIKLDRTNYLAWSQSAKNSLISKGKWDYVTGDIPILATSDFSYSKWRIENALVMTWLLHSMQPSISSTYLFLRTVKDIWDDLADTYSEVCQIAQVYELQQHVWQVKQGELSILAYYNSLCQLWEEIDQYQPFAAKCVADASAHRLFIKRTQVFELGV